MMSSLRLPPLPPRGENRGGEGAPRAKDGRAEGGGGAFQDVEREPGGHAAVLDTDFQRGGARIDFAEPGQPPPPVPEEITGRVVAGCCAKQREPHGQELSAG